MINRKNENKSIRSRLLKIMNYNKDREDYFLKRIKQNGIMLVIEWHYVDDRMALCFDRMALCFDRMALCYL
jgi:hypothetical protein